MTPLELEAVNGWLVANGPVFCPLIRAGQDPAVICPLGQPFLTPAKPDASALPTSPGNVRVSVHPGATGLGATPIREAGPFLVRQDTTLSPWSCLQSLDGRRAVRPRPGAGRHVPLRRHGTENRPGPMLRRVTSEPERARDEEPPGRSLDVAPTRLRGSGGGRGRAIAALTMVALVIAGAVGLAQATTHIDRPIAIVAPPASASIAAPTPSMASASTPPGPVAALLDRTSPRLRPADLAAQIRDGSLENRLVFVDGELSTTPVGCRSLATVRVGCVDLAIPGVGVPVHAAQPWLVRAPAPPLGAWLVTVVRAGALVYLGSLLPDRAVPASIPELDRKLSDAGRDTSPGALFQANGTLVTNIPSPCNNLCPPPPPYLADGRNWDNPALPETGTVVDVVRNAPEIPQDMERFDGTFLLARTSDGSGWEVVARYVPANAVRVQVP